MFAVLAALELVENGILGEWTEALGADKAVLVPDFAAYREIVISETGSMVHFERDSFREGMSHSCCTYLH